ncbi:MAG: hypothetical protein RIR00_1748 [Pseudomonadota bacterium]|jgi:hypothetical protein
MSRIAPPDTLSRSTPAQARDANAARRGTGAKLLRMALAALLLGSGMGASAHDGHRFTLPADYREECGSCHVAYPPSLLDAPAWRAVLAGLEQHFGSDASLDAATRQNLGLYLERHAGRSAQLAARPAPGETAPRLTRTAWFQREHRPGHDGLSAGIWQNPAVKSPANCAACHTGAADGNFSEAAIRLPTAAGARR